MNEPLKQRLDFAEHSENKTKESLKKPKFLMNVNLKNLHQCLWKQSRTTKKVRLKA